MAKKKEEKKKTEAIIKQEVTKVKKPKKEKFLIRTAKWLKLLAKDLKRAKWPSWDVTNKTFIKVIIFLIICAGILYGLAEGFRELWKAIGVN